VDDAFWRDILVLTWDFRTFYAIATTAVDRLTTTKLSDLQLDAKTASLGRRTPDIACVKAFFTFSTAVGTGTGIIRHVPTYSVEWKGLTIFTGLEWFHRFFSSVGDQYVAPRAGACVVVGT
jgi:hypothetical protein